MDSNLISDRIIADFDSPAAPLSENLLFAEKTSGKMNLDWKALRGRLNNEGR